MAQCLFDRIKSSGRLITLPEVVLRLLELARREDVSVHEIADTLACDSTLVAKLIRFVNSPLAGIPHKITSLEHAVAMIGVNGVKMMALSFAVLVPKCVRACRGFDQRRFSVQSVGCGTAARVLATAVKCSFAQEAFLAGLLSQIGRSVLAVGVPEEYAKILAAARQTPRDLPPLERKVLGDTYPVIGAQLLRSWGIPEPLCRAIEEFRQLDGQQRVPLPAKILRVSEVAAEIICPDAKGEPPDSRTFVEAASRLGIQRASCADLMHEIATETEHTRALLELPEGGVRSPADIELEVRGCVAELVQAISLENQRVAEQQADLLRKATTDALTGVSNRAVFDARVLLELQRSARSGAPFALLMIDVDKFKGLNDTYGHQVGDRVLQVVAQALAAEVRGVDCLARYGGDEFAVVIPDTPPAGVLQLAERFRRTVQETALRWKGRELHVTISIGVAVSTEDVDESDAENIIKTADARLYKAKRAGRDRVEMAVDGAPQVVVGTGT